MGQYNTKKQEGRMDVSSRKDRWSEDNGPDFD
jgi:hypothetical protein